MDPDREEHNYSKILYPEVVPKLCRLCLEEKETMWSFFSLITFGDGTVLDISNTFQYLTGEDLDKMENPKMPPNICEHCVDLLVSAHAFHQKYEESTLILNNYLAEPQRNKDESKEEIFDPSIQNVDTTKMDISMEKESTTEMALYKKTKNVITPPRSLQCLICSKEFTFSELKKHCEMHKSEKCINVKNNENTMEQTNDSAILFKTKVKSKTSSTITKSADTKDTVTSVNLAEAKGMPSVPPKLHRCPICPKEFTALELKDHCRSHETLNSYIKSAPKYNKKIKFYAKPRTKNIGLFNQEKIIHTCPFCQQEFEGEPFRDHIKQHRLEGNFRCNICNRIFLGVNHLKMHRLSHKKEAPYKCQECDKSFFRKTNFDFHLLKHTDDKELPFKCDYCEKSFSNPEHLRRHKFGHENEVSYAKFYQNQMTYVQCKQCYQKFKSEEERQIHTCRLFCSKCHRLFDSRRSFKSHVCKNKLKRSQCPPCGKVFQLPSSYKTHKHRCNKQTLCYVCGKNVANIYTHLETHYPHKKKQGVFKCAHCDKQFKFQRNLSRHVSEVHLNIVRFQCQYCSKGFKGRWNLQVHERIHLGIKSHVCNFCGKGFLEKSYLKKHLTIHLRKEELLQ